MSAIGTDTRPAAAKLADALHEEVTLLARALLHAIGETDDPEAIRYLRGRAAMGRPSEALRRFAEEREQQRQEALKLLGVAFDAHADTRAERAAMYARANLPTNLPNWRDEGDD